MPVVTFSWLRERDAPRPEAADAIICLGAGMLHDQAKLPGPASSRRAETCAKLQLAGVAPIVLFTGYGHKLGSVADAMAELAQQRGVPRSAIRVEPAARSTIQNAAFSMEFLPETSDRIVLVWDAFHLPRSLIIFRLLSYENVEIYAAQRDNLEGIPASVGDDIKWHLREAIVIWVNVGRAIVYWGAGLFGVEPEMRIGWFN